MMGGINMIQGHANLDVLDNCALHPVQCVCVVFPDRLFCFFRKNSRENSTNFANVFGNICQIFDITKFGKKEKTPLILMSNVSLKVCWCNFGYLLFFDFNNIWWKTFLPTSIFTSLFKVACSINQILLPLLEGFMDKSGFKSHRLPYRQQWFKTFSKYNGDSNTYSNLHGT